MVSGVNGSAPRLANGVEAIMKNGQGNWFGMTQPKAY